MKATNPIGRWAKFAAYGVGAFVASIALGAGGISTAAADHTNDVLVVNGATSPIPVAAQGTTNVAGTVSIASLPALTLAGSPTVTLAPGGSVTVGNTVLVRDAEDPATTGFNFASNPAVPADGEFGFGADYTVPAGKRLVIENVSAFIAAAQGTNPVGVWLDVTPAGASNALSIPIPCSAQGRGDDTYTRYACNQMVRTYANAGDRVHLHSQMNGLVANAPSTEGTFSGYLVSAP